MKKPLENIAWYVVGEAASRVLGFLVTIYLARVLGPSAFGVINIGFAILGYMILVASPGIQLLETRNVASGADALQERVAGVLALRWIISVVLLLLLAWIAHQIWEPSTGMATIVILYAASVIPAAVQLDWFFLGKEDVRTISLARVVQFIVYAVLAVLLVRTPGDLAYAPAAFFAGSLSAIIVLQIVYRFRYGPIRYVWDPGLWRRILRENLHVGGAVLLGQMATNLPPLAVGYFLTTADVGVFSAAMRLAFGVLFLDRLLNALFLPIVTRYFAQKRPDTPLLLGSVLKATVLVAGPLLWFTTIQGEEIVVLFFGEGYRSAAAVLPGLISYVVVTLINSVFVCTLIGSGEDRAYSRILSLGSVGLGLAVIVATAIAGVVGTAWSIAASETVIMLLMAVQASKVVSLPPVRDLSRLVPAVVALFLLPLPFGTFHPVVQAVIAVGSFAVTLIVSRAVTTADVQFLRGRLL